MFQLSELSELLLQYFDLLTDLVLRLLYGVYMSTYVCMISKSRQCANSEIPTL